MRAISTGKSGERPRLWLEADVSMSPHFMWPVPPTRPMQDAARPPTTPSICDGRPTVESRRTTVEEWPAPPGAATLPLCVGPPAHERALMLLMEPGLRALTAPARSKEKSSAAPRGPSAGPSSVRGACCIGAGPCGCRCDIDMSGCAGRGPRLSTGAATADARSSPRQGGKASGCCCSTSLMSRCMSMDALPLLLGRRSARWGDLQASAASAPARAAALDSSMISGCGVAARAGGIAGLQDVVVRCCDPTGL
mmetsp:Transcript_29543/g.75206  ORF Transcript_29543/g.75206 Transcript_29543/m.75206 type:complete len:252 (+) Transcript_29543:151-906(+)